MLTPGLGNTDDTAGNGSSVGLNPASAAISILRGCSEQIYIYIGSLSYKDL